jgi:hypothetical protein
MTCMSSGHPLLSVYLVLTLPTHHLQARTVFVDEFSLSFHMHYYRLLKWLVAVPFTAAALAVLSMKLGSFNDLLPTQMGSGSVYSNGGLP